MDEFKELLQRMTGCYKHLMFCKNLDFGKNDQDGKKLTIRRFLILGADDGNYYRSAKELEFKHALGLIHIIETGDAALLLQQVEQVYREQRTVRKKALLFTLAVCASYKPYADHAEEYEYPDKLYMEYLCYMHQAAMKLVPILCKTREELFDFVDFGKMIVEESDVVGKPDVNEIPEMPLTTTLHNLAKVTSSGMLRDKSVLKEICCQLGDWKKLRREKIQPLFIVKSLATYMKGVEGDIEWIPEVRIMQALEKLFYQSFMNTPATRKTYCLVFDVSKSMNNEVKGLYMSCRSAATVMAMAIMHNELKVKCLAFSHKLVELPFERSWPIHKIVKHMESITPGFADCWRAIIEATQCREFFEVFIVFTDHRAKFASSPFEALKRYRKVCGVADAKLIVIGMNAKEVNVAERSDMGMLDVAGLDLNVPRVIHEFINDYDADINQFVVNLNT